MNRTGAVELRFLDAFVKHGAGGNVAGVVLKAEGLSEARLQEIARKAGAPETAFVSASKLADFKLRFFTPSEEVPLCGHATVAAFTLLSLPPARYRQETGAGLLGVEVMADGRVFMEQNPPSFASGPPRAAVAAALGLQESSITAPPEIVSTGLKDLFVELDTLDRLLSLEPDFERLRRLSEGLDVGGLHVFTTDTVEAPSTAHCRNFAPRLGIDEEAATGTSNGALACLLFRQGRLDAARLNNLVFEQGYSLKRPSEILARLSPDRVEVGGRAKVSARRLAV